VTGGWRKLHNEELQGLYSSQNIIRVMKLRRRRWAGHVARRLEMSYFHKILVKEPERKRPLGRSRKRWEDNIEVS
jgi:hypothetical protein